MRDIIDIRITDEAWNGTYTYEGSNGSSNGIIDSQADVEGYIDYETAPRLRDSDGDGIPDAWETANGLDPHDISDAAEPFAGANGYTALEVYINSLVEEIMRDGLADTESASTEFFPTYVQPTYTADDYYQTGESTEPEPEEDNSVLVGGTPAITVWEMTNAGPEASSTSELLDTELAINGLLSEMNGGYLRFGSDYWTNNSGLVDDLNLQYTITPKEGTYLTIDSLSFYAKRMGTDNALFSALYDTRESLITAEYIFNGTQPERDNYQFFTHKFEKSVLVSPGEPFIFKILPYSKGSLKSMKYIIAFKDLTFYGRTGTEANISTPSGITPATATPALTAQILTGTTDETTLRYSLAEASKVKIEIVALSGQIVYMSTSEQTVGQHDCLLPLNEVAPGYYICRLVTEESTTSLRIITK